MKYALVAVPALLAVGGVHAITPTNVVSPAVTTGFVTALKYTNVGGSGTYNQVTNMIQGSWPSCTANPSCITSPKQVSGSLAPFDEEMTVVMRGPMTIHNVAVYQPSNSSAATWRRTSMWQQGSPLDNMVVMNNKGGGVSGEWDSECDFSDITKITSDENIYVQLAVVAVSLTPTVTTPMLLHLQMPKFSAPTFPVRRK